MTKSKKNKQNQAVKKKQSSRRRDAETRSTTPQGGKWAACRLVDERSGNSLLGFDFPARLHPKGFAVLDDDLAEQPTRVRKHLKSSGATFTGTKKSQIRSVRRLLKDVSDDHLILACKPGFRKDGFVLGPRMLGTAKGTYRCPSFQRPANKPQIGARAGSHERWKQNVGEVALQSTYFTFGILAALAACVPSYINHRVKTSAARGPIISETFTLNFAGESGSGKTTIVRAAAGLLGCPTDIARWDFSRRGLEELAESRNDLPFILDDVETCLEEEMSLKTALACVTQVLPKGVSKHLAAKAERSDLPSLTFSTIGLTTSPPDFIANAEDSGWRKTDGQRVRFIDIQVPPTSAGGIFDRLEGARAEVAERSKELISQLERGIAQNFGFVFAAWVKYLLEKDRSKRLYELVEKFVRRVAGRGDGWETRFARKFALIYAVGCLAVEAKILPWPKDWPFKAVVKCYRNALRSARKSASIAAARIATLVDLAGDAKVFPRHKGGIVELAAGAIGVRTKHRGKAVIAIREGEFSRFAGSKVVAKEMELMLAAKKILMAGHGGRRTRQLACKLRVGKATIKKPRFLILVAKRLKASAARKKKGSTAS